MYKGTIFERLNGQHSLVNFANDEEIMYKSIANNLSKIFSTNAGSSSTVIDYGRPDLNNINLSLQESLDLIEEACEKCVKKYEPRLFNAKVNISKEKLKHNEMVLFIEGQMLVNGKNKPIQYLANLISNGKIKISRHAN